MDLNHASEVTRRTALTALSGLAGLAAADAFSADDQPRPSREHTMQEIEDEYRRLLPLWQKERQQYELSSNTYDYWKGPHGKAIIALGPAIIPLLIQELRRGDFWFNVPL